MNEIKPRKFKKREKARPVSITFAVTPEEVSRLEEMAEAVDVSRSELLRRIIRFHYALHKL
jgi:hypothetical protein